MRRREEALAAKEEEEKKRNEKTNEEKNREEEQRKKWEEELRLLERITGKVVMSELCKVQAIMDMLLDKLKTVLTNDARN